MAESKNEKEKQFSKDLKANEDASDKLDKELNDSSSVKEEFKKSRKQEILDEYDGLESNVPLNSEYWNLK